MENSRKIAVGAVICVIVAAVAVTVVFINGGRGDGEDVRPEEKRSNSGLRTAVDVQKGAASKASESKSAGSARAKPARNAKNRKPPVRRFKADSDGVFRDSEGKAYPQNEQKIMAAAATAVEKDDVEAAIALAGDALASGNKDLRAAVVDSLGWFGTSALAELTPFMSDPDEEVAEQAASYWMDALQEIEDDGMKASVIEMALNALLNKEQLEDVANELIGIDEKAAMQVIVNVVETSSGAASEVAKDVYETLTCDEWTGVEAAEAWLRENYTPEED